MREERDAARRERANDRRTKPIKPSPAKLWILSDLHLEAVPHPDAFDPPRPDFDVLVCAGDVWEGRTDLACAFLRQLAGDRPVVFVMGNHEHWNGEIEENLTEARLWAEANDVTLLEGEEATIEGTRPDNTPFGPVRFVGCTLWSDYRLAGAGADPRAETGEAVMVQHMDDHGGGEHWLTVADAIALHERSRARLTELIEAHGTEMGGTEAHDDPAVPLVVVTHHAPHPDCLSPERRGTWAAGNGASDLSELTDRGTVALWVHGHLHGRTALRRPAPGDGDNGNDASDPTAPTGSRIVQNAAGPRFHNPAFDERLVIEV